MLSKRLKPLFDVMIMILTHGLSRGLIRNIKILVNRFNACLPVGRVLRNTLSK